MARPWNLEREKIEFLQKMDNAINLLMQYSSICSSAGYISLEFIIHIGSEIFLWFD